MSKRNQISIREYSRIHYWLRKNYGKADRCQNDNCGKKSKHYEWALKNDKQYEKKRENYFMLCKSCHSKYDLTEEGRKRISEYNKKNTPNIPSIVCNYCEVKIKKPRNLQKFCDDCRNIRAREHRKNWLVKNKDWHKKYYITNIEYFRERNNKKYEHKKSNRSN